MTATAENVVPRSIPMIFDIVLRVRLVIGNKNRAHLKGFEGILGVLDLCGIDVI
jgi:hypothetical protein